MIYQLYQKQVEAWKERFEKIVEGRRLSKYHKNYIAIHVVNDLLSSRHKDTIELLEAIIKEVESKEIMEGFKGWEDEAWTLQERIVSFLQAELNNLKENK